MKKIKLNLQLLNEGFAADGAGEGSNSDDAGQNEAKVIYGKDFSDDAAAGAEGDIETEPQASTDDSSDDEYQNFRDKYKEQIGKEIQDAIARRFKNSRSYEAEYNKLSDMVAPFYDRYGVKSGDIDALAAAISNDNDLFEDVAEQNGMTPEAWQRFQKMEAENRRLAQQSQQAAAAEKARQAYEGWVEEAEELKALYPNFDFRKECENKDFVSDINAGKSVRKAYEAAHLEEILAGAIQHTAESVKKSVTDGIRARGIRPTENGSASKPGTVVKDDVNSLTDDDIDKIIKLVKRGAKIGF